MKIRNATSVLGNFWNPFIQKNEKKEEEEYECIEMEDLSQKSPEFRAVRNIEDPKNDDIIDHSIETQTERANAIGMTQLSQQHTEEFTSEMRPERASAINMTQRIEIPTEEPISQTHTEEASEITTTQLPEPHREELVSDLTQDAQKSGSHSKGSLIYRIGSIIINFFKFLFYKISSLFN